MRTARLPFRWLAAAALTLAATVATAAELAGVRLDDRVQVGATPLTLNGTAVRTKFFLKVYVGGLYLPTATHDAAAIIQQDSPKMLVMQFVRDVSRDKLVDAYQEGFEKNAGARVAGQHDNIRRFLASITDVKAHDRITFRYEPGKGSSISVRDGAPLVIPGKEFADLYLLVYLGPEPPTAELKNGLLGR